MATVPAKDTPSNGVVDAANALKVLLPIFSTPSFIAGNTASSSSGTDTSSKAESSSTSGAATTDVTSQGSELGGTAQSITDQLMAALFPRLTGTPDTDTIVNNIIRKAAVAFAPVLGQMHGAGLYNSTTLNQLAGEASSEAVGSAASAVLQANQAYQQTAANAITQALGSVIPANKTATTTADKGPTTSTTAGTGGTTTAKTTTQQQTTTPPIQKALIDPSITSALSTAMLGVSAFKYGKQGLEWLQGKNAADVLGDPEALGGPAAGDVGAASSGTASTASTISVDSGVSADAAVSADAGTAGVQIGNDAYAAQVAEEQAAQVAMAQQAEQATTALNVTNDAAGVAATADIATSAVTDDAAAGAIAASGVDTAREGFDFSGSGDMTAADAAVLAGSGADVARSGFDFSGAGDMTAEEATNLAVNGGAEAGLALNPLSSALAVPGLADQFDAVGVADKAVGAFCGGSSLVCTELVRTGGMSDKLSTISKSYAPKLPRATIRGYHYLCPWLIRTMRKYPLAYKILQWGATVRSQELETGSIQGKLVRATFEPICWILGKTIASDAPLYLDVKILETA